MKRTILKLAEKHPVLTASALYFVIALLFTFPLVLRMGNEIPKGGGDVYQVISSIDTRIVQVRSSDFIHGSLSILKSLNTFTPYVLLGLLMGKIAAYNVIFLLTYVLSGVGRFLLARHYTKIDRASFVAGLVFAFAPFHYYQSVAVHLGTMQQQWLPFLMLFLAKFFDDLRFRHFATTGLFAFLIAMSEHQFLAFTLIYVVFFAAYRIYVNRETVRNRKFWFYVVGSACLLTIVIFGMFGDMLKVATSDNNFLSAGMNAANKYSIKILDPIMPPVFHAIWGGLSAKIQDHVFGDSNRGSYFVGFAVLAVIAYFLYFLVRDKGVGFKDKGYRQDLILWGAVTVVFYVLALGASFSLGSFTVYLPYYLIYKFVPFYENIRTTGRIFVISMAGVAMLTAYASAFLQTKYTLKKNVYTALFSVVILFEFWVAPMSTMMVAYSPFYDRIAKDTESYSLIEIPGSTNYEFASYAMLTDTVHKKPVLNGMPLARKISGQFDMQQETPIIKQLLYTIPKGNDPDKKDMTDILKGFDWSQATDILNYHHVRYVTISKTYADEAMQRLAQSFIEKYIAYANRYEDDSLIAYEIAQKVPTGYYFSLGLKNDQISTQFAGDDKKQYREIGDGAGLKIFNMDTVAKTVTIHVSLKGASSGLKFSIQNDVQSAGTLDGDLREYVVTSTLKPGENDVPFSIRDDAGKAVQISTAKKKHQAALVDSITIESK